MEAKVQRKAVHVIFQGHYLNGPILHERAPHLHHLREHFWLGIPLRWL